MITEELAPIGTLVTIERDDLTLPSKVLDMDGRVLCLAAPSTAGAGGTPLPGDGVQVQWASPRGLWVVPAEVVAVASDPTPTWKVRVAGDADVKQRRRFARAPVDETVQFISETRPSQTRLGWLLDVSEGGPRARVPAERDEAGDRVTLRFSVEGDMVEVSGTLLRVDPSVPGQDQVVVEFPDEHKQAERLRKFVMAEQLRRRRAGLR